MRFLLRKWRNDFQTKSNSDCGYDLFDDWDLIVSSLKKQYGYSIKKEIDSLSWSELSSDIAGLMSDTPLGIIVQIRLENDKEKLKSFTKEQLQIRTEWRNKQAKKVNEIDMKVMLEQFKQAFKSMAGGG